MKNGIPITTFSVICAPFTLIIKSTVVKGDVTKKAYLKNDTEYKQETYTSM